MVPGGIVVFFFLWPIKCSIYIGGAKGKGDVQIPETPPP